MVFDSQNSLSCHDALRWFHAAGKTQTLLRQEETLRIKDLAGCVGSSVHACASGERVVLYSRIVKRLLFSRNSILWFTLSLRVNAPRAPEREWIEERAMDFERIVNCSRVFM